MSSRKRQKNDSGQPIDVSVAAASDTLPPVFALFPSAPAPSATSFSLYSESGDLAAGSTVLAGETDEIEFDSRNQMGAETEGVDGEAAGEGAGYSVQYMLGVHNPRTHTLTLHAAPLHSLSTSIKGLKSNPGIHSSSQMAAQRALLGTTFGTRKAIRAINAQARNKIDTTSFGTSSSFQSRLQDSLTAGTSTLPSAQSIETSANISRPIPPPNFEAQSPGEVYALDDVVPPAELASLDLGPIIAAKTPKERNALLPFRRSTFIADRLRQLLPTRVDSDAPTPGKRDRIKIALLVHLSYLFAFRQAASGGRDSALERAKLIERFGDCPAAIVDGILERYTELQRTGKGGEDQRRITSGMEVKLLGYMLVLVLRIDGWGTDVGVVATDLGMGGKKVQELFRSLGCTLVSPSAGEREKLVTSGVAANLNEARKSKRAVLKVPLEFPKERRGMVKR